MSVEEERDFLVRSLEDLDAERAAGDLADADYRELRDQYAAALRAVDHSEEQARVVRPRRWGQRLVALGLTAALALGAAGFVTRSSDQRLDGEAGTGDVRATATQLLAEARSLLERGEALEAVKRYDSVLEEDPANREALAYRGWVLVLAGLTDEGIASIDRAIAVDADYPDAHLFRGMALQRRGDREGALNELERFLTYDPPAEAAAEVRRLMEEIRQGS